LCVCFACFSSLGCFGIRSVLCFRMYFVLLCHEFSPRHQCNRQPNKTRLLLYVKFVQLRKAVSTICCDYRHPCPLRTKSSLFPARRQVPERHGRSPVHALRRHSSVIVVVANCRRGTGGPAGGR